VVIKSCKSKKDSTMAKRKRTNTTRKLKIKHHEPRQKLNMKDIKKILAKDDFNCKLKNK
jgi:hypothetical protein